jgi:hypothetical protein
MQTTVIAIGPVDEDGQYGATMTVQPVVQPVAKRGQVINEGASRRPLVGRTHDAADEERKSAMRAFFRTAQAESLDTSPCSAERMRRELSIFLGRWIESRRQISAGEWYEAQTALMVNLAW